MGTSNWQNIPFCVEVLMKIEPARVLDVGVGDGRWAVILREAPDTDAEPVVGRSSRVHIEGVPFEHPIEADCAGLYDKIHSGDTASLLSELVSAQWDAMIFQGIERSLPKRVAVELLKDAVDCGAYLIVDTPLGSGSSQEGHASEWRFDDFAQFPTIGSRLFSGPSGRLFATFIISKNDSKGVAELLSRYNAPSQQHSPDQSFETLRATTNLMRSQIKGLEEELQRIRSSLTWKMRDRLLASSVGPALAKVLRKYKAFLSRKRNEVINAPKFPQPGDVRVADAGSAHTTPSTFDKAAANVCNVPQHPTRYTEAEQTWLERARTSSTRAVAIYYPSWMGITSSTSSLFETLLPLEQNLTQAQMEHAARLLSEAECKCVIISGPTASFFGLARHLFKISPQIKINVLYHGNFLQQADKFEWSVFRTSCELAREGVIHKLGFVKAGMAEVVARAGFRSAFVMNYVSTIPAGPSIPSPNGPHIGVYGYTFGWRKFPFSMLASTLLVPGAKVHCRLVDGRVREFVKLLRVSLLTAGEKWIPPDQMLAELSRMHVNLYVTLSECTPMMPLESLSVGAPCLLGPTSHLFEDNSYLYGRLVVHRPDSAAVIAAYTIKALEERDTIIREYQRYAPGYISRARESAAEFIQE